MSDGAQHRQELADKIRSSHLRSSRKLRVTTVLLVSLGVVGCFSALMWFQLRPTFEASIVKIPANATDDYGFLLTKALLSGEELDANATSDVVQVKVYEDYLCDSCKIFHDETGGFLVEQVTNGSISLSYHPFAFLLNQSTDEYSQRATNAAVCVADESGVPAYAAMHDLLLKNQPAVGGPGLTDEELVDLAAEVGVEDVASCITEQRFTPWVEEATQAALNADVSGTPTVRVNGLSIVKTDNGRNTMPGAAEIQYAIEAQQ